MNPLLSFSAVSFRNFDSLELQLCNGINLISGPNGSGKTSLIEALYHLSVGHSFRSTLLKDIIKHGDDAFTLRAEFSNGDTRALQKTRTGKIKAKINNTPYYSTSSFTKDLPTLLIYQDIFQIIDCGPSIRRNLLDWGLFHVEQNYFDAWKHYKKALSQRNALLRTKQNEKECEPWSEQLIHYGYEMHVFRETYLVALTKIFQTILVQVSSLQIDLCYQAGWQEASDPSSFRDMLSKNFEKDLAYGFTQHGAHKADIVIRTNRVKAKSVLSRGQQKTILIALKIAQSKILPRPCLYLFDDLNAELDNDSLSSILQLIAKQGSQVVVTALDATKPALSAAAKKMFHVKHGRVVSA